MSGNQLPVLTLDFSDEKIQKLQEIADKFKNAFSIGPGGLPVVAGGQRPPTEPKLPMPTDPGNSAGQNSVTGRERDEKGRFIPSGKSLPVPGNQPKGKFNSGGGTLGHFFQNLDKTSKGTLKTFTLINKTLKATTSTLKGLFTTTISWGAKLAAISVAGPFGYGYMAHRATEQYKTSQGLGITTGQMQAAKNVYGSRISGTSTILQTLAEAQNDPANPQYAGLMSLGINPQNGAAQNLPVLMERVASLLSQYKGTGVSQTVLNSRGLGGIIDVATANQLLANSDRLPELNKQYQAQSNQLDRNMGSGTQQIYQDVSARFSYNASRIGNTFLNALAKLSGPIIKISDNLTTSIERFINGRNGKALFDTLANGLQNLGNWLGGDDFQSDLKTFADCVRAIVSALGQAIKWIAGNVPGVSLNGAGVGTDGANSAYVDFGNKYLGGNLPGANPMTNQYTGEYFKESDVHKKYQMPDALKTNVQTFVGAVNKTVNLPNGLMPAIAQKESSWNPLALNESSGAAGLFQFMPGTAKAYGLIGNDVYDPNKATVAAGRYLNDLNKRYKGDVAKMLTSYNGGKIDEDGNLSLKKETVDYLLKILPQVQGATEQHPGIMRQLEAANTILGAGGKNDRATITLQVDQKPGSDISAQVKGITLAPRI
ncbi:membrane-bound lytic murein transglycosylase D [Citrobacter werkmanii]|uniref:Membrane-bound lytic murein transglycosylase D n=1 Tax=Citrobacter werkmanii TaxID=67827 RepID=A0A9N8GVE0_9ENTR|nr:transglycosylase SLT domain-containing protein [Citrobacter werkmanii]CAB5539788.1 membrane-bound lytic murein transglycosylase D [Citrobacter werkmanii]CAB5547048.1 membrane-bound lytic murein transglycosylase D [Citrobacter werkmanii]CAB5549528.1 membrane-bound lytic murein transglycosylase D [Citrobacter werkmanii]CAB5567750.1 membrane-bound lytic murein transglycosylase D [Citrobacter werkmanii]CAB5576282.1 membrane-bound lytic murein transglycosylase D [Citrobacter werkmanii]